MSLHALLDAAGNDAIDDEAVQEEHDQRRHSDGHDRASSRKPEWVTFKDLIINAQFSFTFAQS
jgi:hypothetical protein